MAHTSMYADASKCDMRYNPTYMYVRVSCMYMYVYMHVSGQEVAFVGPQRMQAFSAAQRGRGGSSCMEFRQAGSEENQATSKTDAFNSLLERISGFIGFLTEDRSPSVGRC